MRINTSKLEKFLNTITDVVDFPILKSPESKDDYWSLDDANDYLSMQLLFQAYENLHENLPIEKCC